MQVPRHLSAFYRRHAVRTYQVGALVFVCLAFGVTLVVRQWAPYAVFILFAAALAAVVMASRQRQLRETEREARATAEHLDQSKTLVMGILTQELRQPLDAIVTGAHVVEHSNDHRECRRAGALISRQATRVAHLLEDLIDFADLRSATPQLQKEVFDLCSLAQHVAEEVRPVMVDRGQAFQTSYPDGVVPVFADAARVRQLLVHLLLNAARYSKPYGQIRFALEAEDNAVRIRIQDTGRSFTAHDLPTIRPSASMDRRARDGMSIGLAAAEMLMRAHGGSVKAVNDGAGRRSEFIVSLPLATAPSQQRPYSPLRSARR